METKNLTREATQKETGEPVDKKETTNVQDVEKLSKKKKRKHSSALGAASKAGSAVSQANAHSSRDIGFGNTGTNLTYKEDGGVL